MIRLFPRAGLIRAAMWAALLYAIVLVLGLIVAPARSEELEAVVVYIVSDQSPSDNGWKLATNIHAPPDAMDGPMTAMSCYAQAMILLPLWLESNWRGAEFTELRCIPLSGIAAFFKTENVAMKGAR